MATGARKVFVVLLLALATHLGPASASYASQMMASRRDLPPANSLACPSAQLRLRGGGVSDLFSCCLPAKPAEKKPAESNEKPVAKSQPKNLQWQQGMKAVVPAGIFCVLANIVRQLFQA